MYQIDIRLKDNDWVPSIVETDDEDLLGAHIEAIQIARVRTGTRKISFLPVGNNEYIIWGQGTCVGIMSIKEVEDDSFEQIPYLEV